MPQPPLRYSLLGEQVEPAASYWSCKPYLRTVTLDDLRGKFGAEPRFKGFDASPATEEADLRFLKELRDNANEPGYFNEGVTTGATKLTRLSVYLRERPFINNVPAGAVVSRRQPNGPLIENGTELATLFEAETPGLWHRHVFNVLLGRPVSSAAGSKRLAQILSPPRQALIWHLLDVAIDSAMAAIWHFKWLATAQVVADAGLTPDQVRYRRRPLEAARDDFPKLGLDHIVYDRAFDLPPDDEPMKNYIIKRDADKLRPGAPCDPGCNDPDPKVCPPAEGGQLDKTGKTTYPGTDVSPGTPRHPAYGAGHSVYAQAASTVMEAVFRPDPDTVRGCELPPIFYEPWQALADNIGQARWWGGVHWRDDHAFGQAVGKAVGLCLLDQLADAGVPTPLCVTCAPPDTAALEGRADEFCKGTPAPAPADRGKAREKLFRFNPNSSQGAQG